MIKVIAGLFQGSPTNGATIFLKGKKAKSKTGRQLTTVGAFSCPPIVKMFSVNVGALFSSFCTLFCAFAGMSFCPILSIYLCFFRMSNSPFFGVGFNVLGIFSLPLLSVFLYPAWVCGRPFGSTSPTLGLPLFLCLFWLPQLRSCFLLPRIFSHNIHDYLPCKARRLVSSRLPVIHRLPWETRVDQGLAGFARDV